MTEKNCILNGWALGIDWRATLLFEYRLRYEALKRLTRGFWNGVEWFTKGIIDVMIWMVLENLRVFFSSLFVLLAAEAVDNMITGYWGNYKIVSSAKRELK